MLIGPHHDRRLGVGVAALLCLVLAACGSTATTGNAGSGGFFSKFGDIFTTPDWAGFSNAAKSNPTRMVTSDDLISAEGVCASANLVSAVSSNETAPSTGSSPASSDHASATSSAAGGGAAASSTGGASPPADSSATAAPPPVISVVPHQNSGVALGMTECEVAARAGAPEQVNISVDERGERAVVLSYMRGEHPGIYRFRAGRLFIIERVAEPEPEKPKKPTKPGKGKPTKSKPATTANPEAGGRRPS